MDCVGLNGSVFQACLLFIRGYHMPEQVNCDELLRSSGDAWEYWHA